VDKVALLNKFYTTMDKTTLKLECNECGLKFLDSLKSHCTVDYVEYRLGVHKYKLRNMTERYYDYFLKLHVLQQVNVCGYYDTLANDVFSFNLDSNKQIAANSLLELQTAVQLISKYLQEFKIRPLVYTSGRGYHIVVKLVEPLDNQIITKLMKYIWLKTFVTMYRNGLDRNKLSISMYPNRHKEEQISSLRWFGSKHMKINEFSHVITAEKTLDEPASWEYFEWYLNSSDNTAPMLEKAIVEHENYFKKIWQKKIVNLKTTENDPSAQISSILELL